MPAPNPYPDAPSDRAALLLLYETQHEHLARACAGLTPDQLSAHPVPGRWSMQELICHVVDGDLVMSDRVKRTVAMDRPILMEYDETAYVRTLAYDRRDVAAEIDLFRLNRRHMMPILHSLDEAAWQRIGAHSQRGEFTVFVLVQYAVGHANHHLAFAPEKRRAMGL